jgi:hypothetical protein
MASPKEADCLSILQNTLEAGIVWLPDFWLVYTRRPRGEALLSNLKYTVAARKKGLRLMTGSFHLKTAISTAAVSDGACFPEPKPHRTVWIPRSH